MYATNFASCIRYVKDTILKAIYNPCPCDPISYLLYSICQRYNFESNLQQLKAGPCAPFGCIRYVKDTILKAIYNTTVVKAPFYKLYSICQRYNFESNLQRRINELPATMRCIRYVKDTILKAIYNLRGLRGMTEGAVFDMSKIQF